METVRPTVMEKCEFENDDKSILLSISGIFGLSGFRRYDQDISFFYQTVLFKYRGVAGTPDGRTQSHSYGEI